MVFIQYQMEHKWFTKYTEQKTYTVSFMCDILRSSSILAVIFKVQLTSTETIAVMSHEHHGIANDQQLHWLFNSLFWRESISDQGGVSKTLMSS